MAWHRLHAGEKYIHNRSAGRQPIHELAAIDARRSKWWRTEPLVALRRGQNKEGVSSADIEIQQPLLCQLAPGLPGWSQPIWQRPFILLGFPEWRWPRYCQAILSQVRGEQGAVALDEGLRCTSSQRSESLRALL
jgi:hypothetical protein